MMPDNHGGLQPQPPYRPGIGSGGTPDRQISLLCTRLGLDPHHNGHTYHVVIYKYDPGSPAMKAAKDEVSALMWLRSKRFSVPIILAHDFSKNNKINSPYIVESICRGRPAAHIYGELRLEEKKQVLNAVAEAIAQMKSTTFAHWGKLVSSSSNDLSAPKYRRGRVQDDLRPQTKSISSCRRRDDVTIRRRSYRNPATRHGEASFHAAQLCRATRGGDRPNGRRSLLHVDCIWGFLSLLPGPLTR